MTATSDSAQSARGQPWIFARWLARIGFVLLLGSGALAARLIWEMTVWSWERGPQMVGFQLVHGGGALLVFFPLLLICWLAIAVLYTALSARKGRKVSRACLTAMGLSIAMLGILWLPYGFWQRLFVDRLVKSPHAGDFFVFDAATGDLATVKAFVAHGLPPKTPDGRGKTALDGAAAGGNAEVVQYLISVGAGASASPHSPRMSDEQASKIIDEQVRKEMEKGEAPGIGPNK